MFNKFFLLLIGLVSILVFTQGVSALTASSENYSVARFGTGVQATNLNSADLTGRALSITGASTRNAENDNLFVNVGFWANTSYHVTVSIISYSIYPISAVHGSIIKLSISALNSQSVWAILTLPTGANETITLTNNGDKYYTANSVGVYNVIFYANSSQGNLASVIDSFEITSPVIPPTTPPSSGGGTTTIIEKSCTYNWDCTPWSICSDLNQTRECKNIGNCTGIQSKIEARECSDALFDVVLKLKDVNLTKNETLKFGIDLTEKKGIEKIDVQIKYSIIDSNNTEIFSQIETRAIQENLTYEKEIKEIKLTEGDYILRIDILYGNLQRAFAEQKFKVKGKGIEIEPILESNYNFLLILLIIAVLLISLRSLFMLKKNKHLTKFEKSKKSKKKYCIKGLINKKVYSDNGNYIGEIKDVVLGRNRIESLKINLDKKHKLRTRGIIVHYKHVRSVGEIVIIDKAVAEHLEKYKDSRRNLIA